MDLKDEQWIVIEPLLPKLPKRPDGRGRPWKETRAVFNGILWILRTGAPWHDMPDRYPPYQTCHRRFQQWVKDGTMAKVLRALAEDLRERGHLDLTECFIDGTFILAKKGASTLERPSGAKVRSSWQWQTALVFLSRCTWPVLARMKSDLRKKRLKEDT